MNVYAKHLGRNIPQTEKAAETQVKNNAGGFVFKTGPKARLERFLILGADGPTYYVKGPKLLEDNLNFVVELIKQDQKLVADAVRDVSVNGRAYKNSPAIFTVALLLKHATVKKDLTSLVVDVCRTSTHLFELAEYIELLGGWGRGKRAAIAAWYLGKSDDKLAYQLIKYRQRNGWTHADLLRLSHPKAISRSLSNFVLGKDFDRDNPDVEIVEGFKTIQKQTDVKKVLANLDMWPSLPWEALPTQFHKDASVWKKLFANGQLKGQALIRNITRLARMGAFNDMMFVADYAAALVDEDTIRRSRLHPINYLNALIVHQNGQIERDRSGSQTYSWGNGGRKKDWTTVPQIVDALNRGYYLSFKYVEPANKRFFLGVDVSGSMGTSVGQGLDISCAQAAGAMAMAIAKTEPYYQVRGFTSSGYGYRSLRDDHDPSGLTDLGITPNQNLDEVFNRVLKSNFGSTDCSLPMVYAQKNNIEVDTFVVLTDNETYAGAVHPYKALQNYRKASGIDAKLIVVGMTATDFTIADPSDHGMLDVAGLDSNLPKLVTEFASGRI